MSFILDALKKSEQERLRQQNPSTPPIAMSRSSDATPAWVWGVLGLLAVNLLVLAVVLLKPATEAKSSPVRVTSAPATAPATISPSATSTPDPIAPNESAVIKAKSAVEPVVVSSNMSGPSEVAAPSRPLSALPSREEQLAAGANLPAAALNLHVFDADPIKRFVLLNGERLREGDVSRDGLNVMSITPEGVILSYGNSSFAVSIEGR